jgi:hypothetical protein
MMSEKNASFVASDVMESLKPLFSPTAKFVITDGEKK